MRKLILTLLFLSSLFARDALAACSWNILVPEPVKEFVIPPQTVIKAAPIGQELAKHRIPLWQAETISCTESHTASLTLNGGLRPSSLPKVYETGIEGIGVKLCLALNQIGNDMTFCVPWENANRTGLTTSRFIDVVFVRTGHAVGSGNIPLTFEVTWAIGSTSLVARTRSSTELINDVLFAGCEAVDTVVNVPMDQENIERLKSGRVAVKPFNFDVRCTGLKPTTTAPVKVYFAGDSSTDGMLALSGAGTPGVASGIGISLVNDKGVKLPFDKARSIGIEHHRSDAKGEIYRFSGTAKYALTTGEAKPGKADATMTFVIDYN